MPSLLDRLGLPVQLGLLALLCGAIIVGATTIVTRSLVVDLAVNQSRAVADMAEHIGTWASRYGSVAVHFKGIEAGKVGTYLERQLYAPDGARGHSPDPEAFDAYYFKNPATVQREVSEISAQSPTGNRFRLTAESVFNPANKPDAFELRALAALRDGQRSEYFEAAGNQLRYARSVIPDASCLACHGSKLTAPAFLVNNPMFTDGGFGWVAGRPTALVSVGVRMPSTGKALAQSLSGTGWSALAALLGALLLLASVTVRRVVLWRMRTRQNAARAVEHLRVRQLERERIAADLHDTLLQGIYGLLLRMQSLLREVSDVSAREALEASIDRAEKLAAEGRDRVSGLHSAHPAMGDLRDELRQVASDLEREQQAHVSVEGMGTPRPLLPQVHEQLYFIGREAMFNAAAHAEATAIVVTLDYGSGQFTLGIRDDGRGLPPPDAQAADGARHWGLAGMRERALRVGGELELVSRPGHGTAVRVRVPADSAYLP
jgi:signal transduction histidine kinase